MRCAECGGEATVPEEGELCPACMVATLRPARKKILIEGKALDGDTWTVEAAMEGGELGTIFVTVEDKGGIAACIACHVADLDLLIGALSHAATSIAWIEQHGLEPTYQGAAEPPS